MAAVSKSPKPSKRGFAAISPTRRREIARLGGLAVAKSQDMRALGAKGGTASQVARKATR